MKFQPQTFEVARFDARKEVGATDVENAEADPMKERLRSAGLDLGNEHESVDSEGNKDVDEDAGVGAKRTGIPESDSGLKPEAIPAPASPPLSV